MGLRDRLRGLLGRERPAGPPSTARDTAPGAGVPAAPVPTPVPAPVPYGPDALAAALVVDVRGAAAFAEGHVPGARLLPPADVRGFAKGAPSDRPVVAVCDDGTRSAAVAERLVALGVRRAGWLEGGLGSFAGPLAPLSDAHGGAA